MEAGNARTMTMLEITKAIIARATGQSPEVVDGKAHWFLANMGVTPQELQITVPFAEAQQMINEADMESTRKHLAMSPLQLKLIVASKRLTRKLLGGKHK